MPVPQGLPDCLARLAATLQSETDDWRQAQGQDAFSRRQAKAVAERGVRHRLVLLQLRFGQERRRLERDEARKIRNFRELLDSIDALKVDLQAYYPAMPRAVSVMIHHHATTLLSEAWHSPSRKVRQRRQTRFTALMLAVREDLAELARGATGHDLPQRTLDCIREDKQRLP
jgi:hypothetical protein